MIDLYILLLLFNIIPFINCHTITQYNVGALFNLNNYDGTMDLEGIQAKEAILMALREINNKADGLYDELLPNITLKLATEHPSTAFSTATVAANSIRKSFNGNGIRACIGPKTNAAIAGSATILREKGIFQIGYGGQDDAYGVKETFPSFVRVNTASGVHARVLATMIYKYFRWERVAIIHSYNVYGYYVHLKFLQSIQSMGFENTLVFTDYGTKNYVDLISQVKKSGATIFILLFSPATWAIPVIKEAWIQGLFREGTQIFAIEEMTNPLTWQLLSNSYRKKHQIADTYTDVYSFDMTNEEIASLMKGFIGLRVMIDKSRDLSKAFLQRWNQQENTNFDPRYGHCNNATDDSGNYLHQVYDTSLNQFQCRGINFSTSKLDGSDIFQSAFFAYDAILLLARSLDYFLRTTTRTITSQNQITFFDLQEILNQIESIGITGLYTQSLSYELRSDNERKSDLSYSIFTFDPDYFLKSTLEENEIYNGVILPSSKGLFYTGRLHSEELFLSCYETTVIREQCYVQGYDPNIFNCTCSKFIYDTLDGNPPNDLPHLQTIRMSPFEKNFLRILSIFFFLIISFTSFLLYNYRKCRLVKITQPELSVITFLGGICICIGVIISSIDIQAGSCQMIDVFFHMGFILIFSPLVTKTWRIYMIMSWNLKRVQITMKQTLSAVGIFVSISVVLLLLVEIHRPDVDYQYVTLKDTPLERTRAKYCPAGEVAFAVPLYVYEAIVILIGGLLCYLTRNLPSGISDSSQVANAIAGIIACAILGVSLSQLTKMNHKDFMFVSILLIIVGAIRALHVCYRSLTLKLLEGYDLDAQFQSVQVREPISFFALLAKTKAGIFSRIRRSSNQTITPTESPKSLQMRSPATTDNGARPHREQNLSQLQNPSRIFDERQRIEREIDILQHRLELLANRALYASRLHQISEPPDVRSSESQPPRKLKLYSGSTAGLSASHKNIPQDLSGDRLGSDSYYEDHPPLSHRSTNELPYPLSTLPLYQLPEQKSDVEAGNGSSRGLRQFDNPPPQRFQRNDNRRISEEEKPHSDVDNISEVC